METTSSTRPLVLKTPVLAVQASAVGISILGEDHKKSRFERYDQRLDELLEKRRLEHKLHQQQIRWKPTHRKMNPIQSSMYRRVMYGLGNYTAEQLTGMDSRELQRIDADYKRGQTALHRLKCDEYFGKANRLWNAIWPGLNIGGKPSDYQVKLPARVTLHRLRISTERVVTQLQKWKLLPQNFWQLSMSLTGEADAATDTVSLA